MRKSCENIFVGTVVIISRAPLERLIKCVPILIIVITGKVQTNTQTLS